MLKRYSLNYIRETMKKGRVISQAFISHVYVTVSSLKIAVNTVPIFLT